MKEILGIHGFKRTDKVVDFFQKTKENLEKEGFIMINPDFEIGDKINYKNWEKKLNEINVKNFDIILAHSMGCRVAMEYISEHKINIDKLILVAPAIEVKTQEIIDFYTNMKHLFQEINVYVKEIIILISDDDTIIRLEGAKKLANELNAKLIETTGYGHFNFEEVKIIEKLIKI